MLDIGGPEFLIIIIAVLLLFGPRKLPEVARSIGKWMAHIRRAKEEFDRNIHGFNSEIQDAVDIDNRRAGKSDAPANAGTSQDHNAPPVPMPATEPTIDNDASPSVASDEPDLSEPETDHRNDAESHQRAKPQNPPITVRPAARSLARNQSTNSAANDQNGSAA